MVYRWFIIMGWYHYAKIYPLISYNTRVLRSNFLSAMHQQYTINAIALDIYDNLESFPLCSNTLFEHVITFKN